MATRLIFGAAIVGAQEAGQLNILVLHSYDFDLPQSRGLQNDFRAAQRKRAKLRSFVEYLGAPRTRGSITKSEWATHLTNKYREIGFYVAIGNVARLDSAVHD